MRKTPNFYLAHSFQCMKKIRRWQIMMEGRYNIKFVNPFYSNKYEDADELGQIKSKAALTRYLDSMPIGTCKGIMERDLELIRKSDGIVSYFESPTIGTCQEIIIASYHYRIPVYIITGKYKNHPWIRALANISGGKIFRNRTEFKKYAEKKWGKKL